VARGAVSWSEEAATDEEGFLIGGEEEFIVGKMAGWEMGLSGQERDGTRVYWEKAGRKWENEPAFPLRDRLNPPFPTCFDASG